jgi:Domain of unknown function (DUF5615)
LKVALDEGVPEGLIEHLSGHDVQSVRQLGLKSVKNGQLLALIERAQFDAFITNDKKMEAEGQLSRRPFAILILSATNWNVIKPHVGNIANALKAAKPGEVARVHVGRFVPVKRRYSRGP